MSRPAAAPAPLATLLRTPGFARVWAAGTLTNAMRWLEILVVAVVAFELTGSAFAVAAVTTMRALPLLVAGALAGALADGVDRRRLLLAGQALLACSATVMALLAANGLLALWHLALASLVTGIVWSTDMAVRRRILGDLAGEALAARGIALDTVTVSVTRMLGPLLGGLALETVGVATAFAAAAAVHLCAFVLARPIAPAPARRAVSLRSMPRDVAEAVAVARSNRTMRTVLLGTLVMNVFGFSYIAVLPAWGAERFGASPFGIGLLAAAEPLGALIGGLALAAGALPRRPAAAFAIGVGTFLAALAAASAMPVFGAAWTLLVLGGLGSSAFSSYQTTLVIQRAPIEARSRLMGLVTTCIGVGPAGVLVVGALADRIGPAPALTAMAVTGIALLLLAVRRGVGDPPPPNQASGGAPSSAA